MRRRERGLPRESCDLDLEFINSARPKMMASTPIRGNGRGKGINALTRPIPGKLLKTLAEVCLLDWKTENSP